MRDITALHPLLQVKIAELKLKCEKAGLKIGIGECLRTVAEQDALYAQGRTKPGSIVTNARGSTYSSQHQWGIAFDFYRNDGKGAFYDLDGFFTKVGALAKQVGLGWGGDWKSPVDKPHVYLPQWGSTTSALRSAYGGVAAWIWSALIFGAVHVVPSVAVNAALCGLVLGFYYLRYRSLVLVILLHAMNNLTACFLRTMGLGDMTMREAVANDGLYTAIYAACVTVCVMAAARMFRLLRRVKGDNSPATE